MNSIETNNQDHKNYNMNLLAELATLSRTWGAKLIKQVYTHALNSDCYSNNRL